MALPAGLSSPLRGLMLYGALSFASVQSCKKIIDLDLKDRDHSIDLDLLGDLDHCW